MAKKTKKVELNDFEKAVVAIEEKPIEVAVKIGDNEYVVNVEQHIASSARSIVIDMAEDMYYPNGEYDPNHGDAVLDFVLFQLYTGVTFGNDLDAFEKFKHTDAYTSINSAFSEEYDALRGNVWDKATALKRVYFVSEELRSLYDAGRSAIVGLNKFVDGLDVVLTSTMADMKKNDDISLKDMLDAMQAMKGKDEKKIAKAILEHQEAKAKKIVEVEAVATPKVFHL